MEEIAPLGEQEGLLAILNTAPIVNALSSLDRTIQKGIQDMRKIQGHGGKKGDSLRRTSPHGSAVPSIFPSPGNDRLGQEGGGEVRAEDVEDTRVTGLVRRKVVKPAPPSNGAPPGELSSNIDMSGLRKTADGPIPACTWTARHSQSTAINMDFEPVKKDKEENVRLDKVSTRTAELMMI